VERQKELTRPSPGSQRSEGKAAKLEKKREKYPLPSCPTRSPEREEHQQPKLLNQINTDNYSYYKYFFNQSSCIFPKGKEENAKKEKQRKQDREKYKSCVRQINRSFKQNGEN